MPGADSAVRLPVTGHLEELRRRLLWAGGTTLVLAAASLLLVPLGIEGLKWPVRGLGLSYVLVKPAEIVVAYLKLALFGGMVLASPVWLYHAWRFVTPAWPAGRRPPVGWLPAAVLLFGAGAAFALFVALPAALAFFLRLAHGVAEPMLSLNFFVSFALALMTAGGAAFEIPVVVALLAGAGIVSTRLLRRRRREVLFGLVVAAAVLTPTTDLFNLALFVLPLALLYELGIGLAWLIERARARRNPEGVYGA